jgi:hypothetical protein
MDPLYLLLAAGFFALTTWLALVFEKIRRQK